MVMELLGPNLETVLKQSKDPFAVSTAAFVGIQMLKLVRHLHSRSFIHRDIKPENFTVGYEELKNYVYMIDFGLAKYYRDPKTKLHVPYRNNKSLIGTARYASINTHLGLDQTRRDDIEALLYVLIYFMKGSLPWQGYKECIKTEKYAKIVECKLTTPIESLCKDLPREIANLLYYARLLRYDEKPDYAFVHNSLVKLLPCKSLPTRLLFERVTAKEKDTENEKAKKQSTQAVPAQAKNDIITLHSKNRANSASPSSVDKDNIIPNERTRPNVIPLIPTANYIANSKHFAKYKSRWLSNVPSKSLQPDAFQL
eukprot:TRINITY_DN81_c0_g1_i35.p1 TRINITY_DN81_c0_g1~~TRINITY_DN81_c0_g1_i35.p1  ORF type:complete len:312 (+),score=74.66 TRINITY_DN81_c0_g1_i35:320-1255(+)